MVAYQLQFRPTFLFSFFPFNRLVVTYRQRGGVNHAIELNFSNSLVSTGWGADENCIHSLWRNRYAGRDSKLHKPIDPASSINQRRVVTRPVDLNIFCPDSSQTIRRRDTCHTAGLPAEASEGGRLEVTVWRWLLLLPSVPIFYHKDGQDKTEKPFGRLNV
jgi:hypothetical protein